MRLTICAVGRLKSGPEHLLITDYATRFNRMGRSLGLGPLKIQEVEDKKNKFREFLKLFGVNKDGKTNKGQSWNDSFTEFMQEPRTHTQRNKRAKTEEEPKDDAEEQAEETKEEPEKDEE